MDNRILFLMPSLRCNDGIARVIMGYYESLIERGWNADFLLVEEGDNAWSREIEKNRGHVYKLPKVNKYSQRIKKMIESILKKEKYDIVHVNIPGHVGYITLKEARKCGVKRRLFHAHNPKNTLNIKTIISTDLYDFLIKREASELIACAASTGKERFRDRPFKIIRNVIDVNRFTYDTQKRENIRKELNVNGNTVIGVVGRFAAQKNPAFLIECFAEYKKIDNDAFLVWIGDGELKEAVENKVDVFEIKKSCYFAGRKENVEDWYSAMDLFLLPSKFEGLGIVFLEAQCTGLPCLGSTNVPIETEVTDLMHRIDLKCNAKQWAAEMKKIVETQKERYSRAQEFIDAGYTREATRYDLADYYDALMRVGVN